MVSELWDKSRALIFIMATGIVIRTIAPLIKDKRTDPAIIVLDERGRFAISLLCGHSGGANDIAKEIADFLGGEAVITTAYDRPKNLVIGIGCDSRTSEAEIEETVKRTLKENNLSFSAIHSISTLDKKGNELGLIAFAKKYGFEINTFTPDELNMVKGISRSEAAFKSTGANAVSEPAAILASEGRLIVHKQRIGNVTVAVAELNTENRTQNAEHRQGKIYIVGTGPGGIEHITLRAQRAIRESDIIVGYSTYLNLIQELTKDKKVISAGMTEEIDRCKKALELALTGKTVALISGGDPGIYAMAGLVFELLRAQSSEDRRQIEKTVFTSQDSELHSSLVIRHSSLSIEVIPAIAALNACAARLGAPLMHDFVSISLSDRLTPWDVIEKRLEAAAAANFVIILYNPKSKERARHIAQARDIILKYRSPQTPVGIVRAAMRDDEEIIITDLEGMLKNEIDMQSTVIVGNSQTFVWENWIVTPRGYGNKYEVG